MCSREFKIFSVVVIAIMYFLSSVYVGTYLYDKHHYDLIKIGNYELSLFGCHMSLIVLIISLPCRGTLNLATRHCYLSRSTTSFNVLFFNKSMYQNAIQISEVLTLPDRNNILIPNNWSMVAPHSYFEVPIDLAPDVYLNGVLIKYKTCVMGKQSQLIEKTITIASEEAFS